MELPVVWLIGEREQVLKDIEDVTAHLKLQIQFIQNLKENTSTL